MAKILAIDYGEKRIGLASSDENQRLAFEYQTWPAAGFLARLPGLVAEMGIAGIVLGYPLNLSGGESAKTREVLKFKSELEAAVAVPVELLDERLSSVGAARIAGTSKNIDALAAQLFLQNYLDLKNKDLQNKNENAIEKNQEQP